MVYREDCRGTGGRVGATVNDAYLHLFDVASFIEEDSSNGSYYSINNGTSNTMVNKDRFFDQEVVDQESSTKNTRTSSMLHLKNHLNKKRWTSSTSAPSSASSSARPSENNILHRPLLRPPSSKRVNTLLRPSYRMDSSAAVLDTSYSSAAFVQFGPADDDQVKRKTKMFSMKREYQKLLSGDVAKVKTELQNIFNAGEAYKTMAKELANCDERCVKMTVSEAMRKTVKKEGLKGLNKRKLMRKKTF